MPYYISKRFGDFETSLNQTQPALYLVSLIHSADGILKQTTTDTRKAAFDVFEEYSLESIDRTRNDLMRDLKAERAKDGGKAYGLAKRLFKLSAPWERDGETVESIAEQIQNDPQAVISYLLDMLE